ncbi:MAG: hypothetical protein LBG62_06720 [Candidatus Methanoplasma sp.]|jgi:ABC-type Fe3+-hydroxamate transport system substrate-binding protein|nr:hypothetical protein [Candidatus Methanoplasma sp.]
MDRKILFPVLAIAILVAASAAVFLVRDSDAGGDKSPSTMEQAELKVFGNANGDRRIDGTDLEIIEEIIKGDRAAADYPLADANNDGAVDRADADLVEKIMKGESATITHVNYYNGGEQIVTTKFPVRSAIMTGSSSAWILTFQLGILDEIKGSSQHGKGDTILYRDSYLDESKCAFLSGGNDIDFENGRAGSSNVIIEKKVTALIADSSKSYITKEKDFENVGVDVVRVTFASVDRPVVAHSALLLGLLFQKVERSIQYLEMFDDLYGQIDRALGSVEDRVSAVASGGHSGTIASTTYEYGKIVMAASGDYGLKNFNFAGATSVKVAEQPSVFDTRLYNYDYVIQFSSFNSEGGGAYRGVTQAYCDGLWDEKVSHFAQWEHNDTGQYIISLGSPVMVRLAYTAAVFYPDIVSMDWADQFHQKVVDALFNGQEYDVSELTFVIHK